jgi:hypothetical protein
MRRFLPSLLLAGLGLIGCALPREQATQPTMSEALEKVKAVSEARWKEHFEKVDPRFRDAVALGETVKDADDFAGAAAEIGKLPKAKDPSEAITRDKAFENAFEGGVKLVAKNEGNDKVGQGFTTLARSAPTKDTKKLAEAMADAASAPPERREEAEKEAVKVAAQTAEQIDAPKFPPGDPELQKHANKATQLARQIREAAKAGQSTAQLTREFVDNAKLAETRMGKVLKEGADGIDKVAGPAMELAGAVGSIGDLVESWDDKSDIDKICGVMNTLADTLAAVQPFLAGTPVGPYKMAAMLVLKVLSAILPKLFGGGDGGGGKDGNKPDGEGDKGKDKGKGKGQTPARPTKDKGKGKGPKPKEPTTRTGQVVKKAAGNANHHSSPEGAARAMAQEVGKQLHLSGAAIEALRLRFEKVLKDNPKMKPADLVEQLTGQAETVVGGNER